MRPGVERGEAAELRVGGERGGDVNAGDPAMHHRLRLAERRAADPDGARLLLHPGDANRFVGLGVRA